MKRARLCLVLYDLSNLFSAESSSALFCKSSRSASNSSFFFRAAARSRGEDVVPNENLLFTSFMRFSILSISFKTTLALAVSSISAGNEATFTR